MRKVGIIIIALACITLLSAGCISQRRATHSQSTLLQIEKIEIMEGEPTKPYIELGLVEHRFNPLDSAEEIRFTLREQAYSKYGNVDTIMRVSSIMVTGYDFPLRLVRGVAIKYIK